MKYKAVFAEPKSSARSSNSSSTDRGGSRFDDFNMMSHGSSTSSSVGNNFSMGNRLPITEYAPFFSNAIKHSFGAGKNGNNKSMNCTEVQLNIICSSSVNQDQLWRLFDIVPGLEYCKITGECDRNSVYATAAYNSLDAAQYARYARFLMFIPRKCTTTQ